MGWAGSRQRASWGAVDCTEDRRAIDIRELQRRNQMTPGGGFSRFWSRNGEQVASLWARVESNHIKLRYRQIGDGSPTVESSITITRTPQHFGGERQWFQCPARHCSRRVANLYVDGYGAWGCRQCHKLAYRSQRENGLDRKFRKVGKIREKLKWPPGIVHFADTKPKWMRWPTYLQLAIKHDHLVKGIVGDMREEISDRAKRSGHCSSNSGSDESARGCIRQAPAKAVAKPRAKTMAAIKSAVGTKPTKKAVVKPAATQPHSAAETTPPTAS